MANTTSAQSIPETPEAALTRARTQTGETIASLSRRRPLLLVFLRHFG